MTESEFLDAAESTLRAIEQALDASAADVDVERSGNVLTLVFDDASRAVVNIQVPMSQIWLAGRSGAHHFALREGAWVDTRDGTELFAALSRVVSAQAAQAVVLKPKR
ncbi:MAG TPA: iron donor protein CyaY [Burkholderiaceae bacterium]|nr:iron donor protein CyaY [Burkholderiaceae bacterium]